MKNPKIKGILALTATFIAIMACSSMVLASPEESRPINQKQWLVSSSVIKHKSGWSRNDSGRVCYYDDNGKMLTGWQELKGCFISSSYDKDLVNWFYFDKDGSMAVSWKKISGKWYYFTNTGYMVDGWQKIGDNWYFFKIDDGYMVTGLLFSDIGNKAGWYYLTDSGAMLTNSWKQINGKWYYFGSDGANLSQWQIIGRNRFYFDPTNGYMCTGWTKIDGSWYYFSDFGTAVKGWHKSGDSWYYLDKYTGEMLTGKAKIEGKYYYFDPNSGAMVTGWKQVGSGNDGVWYYFSSSGAALTGWQTINGKQYFFDPSFAYMCTGWKLFDMNKNPVEYGGYYFYFDSTGAMVHGTTITIDGEEFTFADDGRCLGTE